MNNPVVALALAAFALVAIFLAVWAWDARRSKGQETDGERLDVANDE